MRKISILLLVIWALSNNACKKNKDNWDINIYGYLYDVRDSAAYKNTEFVLLLDNRSYLSTNKDKLYYFSTDEKGYFQVTYSKPPGYSGPELCWPDNISRDCGNKIVLPKGDEIYTPYKHDLGNLYITKY